MSGQVARRPVQHGSVREQEPVEDTGGQAGVDGLTPEPAVAATRAAPPPWLKLVVSLDDHEWTGVVYPTQSNRGARQHFASREELVDAVVRLTGWDSAAD